jgi:coenzyme F420-reducing hydrogenase delta subunit
MAIGVETAAPSTKILVLASLLCAYPGIDSTGQAHLDYPANTYVLPTPDPVMFPERFYLYCFEHGIDGVLIASCGTDSPYEGTYEQLAARIDRVYAQMKERGIDIRRLKLTAICSVCSKAFVKEIGGLAEIVAELGPVGAEGAAPNAMAEAAS